MRAFASALFFFLFLCSFAQAEETGRHAIFVSYNTPVVTTLAGRVKILRFLEARGFHLHIVSDRYADQTFQDADRIAPSPENFISTFQSLVSDPSVKQLAIFTDLHGDPRKPNQITHSVRFGADRLDLDRFIPGLQSLNQRPVPVPVVWMDFSCYSGASLPLGETGACLSSDGSSEKPTMANFVDLYADELRAGRSFADVFLGTREQHLFPVFPSISDSAGLSLVDTDQVMDTVVLSSAMATAPEATRKKVGEFAWTLEERAQLEKGLKILEQPLDLTPRLDLLNPMAAGTFIYGQIVFRASEVVRAERSLYQRSYESVAARESANACRDFKF